MQLTPAIWNWDAGEKYGRSTPPLHPDAPVALWLARLPADPSLHRQLHALLSPDEQARMARFHRREDQQRYLAGRGLLRRLLGAHLNQPAEDLKILTGTHGKPFITPAPGHSPVHFNVSHSGDFVLVALSTNHEVGVDIEHKQPGRDVAAIAARVFTETDYQAWLRLPSSAQPDGFYRAWTRHEARLKALGHGFANDPGEAALSALACFDLNLPENYAGAVAICPVGATSR